MLQNEFNIAKIEALMYQDMRHTFHKYILEYIFQCYIIGIYKIAFYPSYNIIDYCAGLSGVDQRMGGGWGKKRCLAYTVVKETSFCRGFLQ